MKCPCFCDAAFSCRRVWGTSSTPHSAVARSHSPKYLDPSGSSLAPRTPGAEGVDQFTGWWYTHPSEKYEFVSWDDDIPNINGKIKVMFQTTNQIICRKHNWKPWFFFHWIEVFPRQICQQICLGMFTNIPSRETTVVLWDLLFGTWHFPKNGWMSFFNRKPICYSLTWKPGKCNGWHRRHLKSIHSLDLAMSCRQKIRS